MSRNIIFLRKQLYNTTEQKRNFWLCTSYLPSDFKYLQTEMYPEKEQVFGSFRQHKMQKQNEFPPSEKISGSTSTDSRII
jgi:hypothetical protein